MRSPVSGVIALGDCNDRGVFAHTSTNDFEIVADTLLRGGSRRVGDRLPAHAVLIDPPLARVGISQ